MAATGMVRGISRAGLRGAGVALAMAVGVLLSFLLFDALRGSETQDIGDQFRLVAVERMRAIGRDLDSHVEIVRGVRAFYEGSKAVDRDEFRAYTDSALRRHGSFEGLEWAPVVSRDGRTGHENAMRAMGIDGYEIRDPGPDGPVRAPSRAEYVPVSFLEPCEGHEDRRGIDLAVIPAFRETMERARDTGEPAANLRVRIGPGDDPESFAMLLVVAVYRKPRQVHTQEDRRRNLQGYALALIRLKPIVEEVLRRVRGVPIQVNLFDRDDRVLHRHVVSAPLADPVFRANGMLTLADAKLIYSCMPPRAFVLERRSASPLWMGLGLLLVIGVVVAYVYLLTRHADRVERLVAVRTAMIREVSSLQQAILDGAPYTIVSTDPDGTIRTFNRAAERMLGYTAEQVVGRVTTGIFHKPAELEECADELVERGLPREEGIRALLASAAAGSGDAREWTFVRRDGTEFPVSLSVTALRDESGEVTGFVGMGEDITKRKQSEAALVAAKTAAEEASRTKSRFLANMSHELRTPLNAIIGYSEMMEEDALTAGKSEVAGDLRRVTEAARHLLLLISDVLDLSKIEAGRIEIHDEPVALDRLLGEATGMVSRLVERNGNTLEATCDPAIGTMVTDATRVRQILYNLLSNAAKFTHEGSVTVRAALQPGPPPTVVITVADTGIGIAPDQLERIFEPFSQADSSTTRKFGGTGLGLAICREFCRLMHGTIEVESEPGRGSTFTVTLPYHRGVPVTP